MSNKKKEKPNKTGHQTLPKEQATKKPVRKEKSKNSLLPGRWIFHVFIFFMCIAATALLYSGDLHLGFFRIDDPQYVQKNPWIRSISPENIRYILTHPYFANYSPMHLFSYMIDYAIGGNNAFVFHFSSNIWAGLVAGFLYLLTFTLTQKRIIAIAAAVLFIVHPVHVESVAWISSRKDLVAATFILPSFLAYLKYRKGRSNTRGWYILSLVLYLFAIAGKLSVAAFPAVFFLYDWLIEKRPFLRSLVDKIPYLITAALFALAVSNAQPATGGHTDTVILSKSLVQSIWLMTGFGEYVIYRVPPVLGEVLFKIAGIIFLFAVFFLPLLLRRRYPMIVILIYWILLTYLPTQILSFTYPVTDRYLFLPSAAFCILITWLLSAFTQRLKKWKMRMLIGSLVILVFFWTKNTLNYLDEWRDPRSVWYGALKKSNDPQVYHNLGWQFSNRSAAFGSNRRKEPLPIEEAKQYASLVWKDDPQLSPLLNELNTGQHDGPIENEFKKYLQLVAMNYLDSAVVKKEKRVMSDLFLTRGILYLDMGEIENAKKEFFTSLDEASRLGFAEAEQEIWVNCHYNIGVAEWTLGNYKEAYKWIKMAEDEQNRTGADWVAGISEHRKRLEQIIQITETNQ